MTSRRFRVIRRASWMPFQNLRSRTALRCRSTAGSVWFNQMGTTSKDATVHMTKNSTNAEIWTQVGYFSDTPRMKPNFSIEICTDISFICDLKFVSWKISRRIQRDGKLHLTSSLDSLSWTLDYFSPAKFYRTAYIDRCMFYFLFFFAKLSRD